MIRLPDRALDPASEAILAGYQAAVDAGASYAERVALAKRLFGQRNTTSNPTFRHVRRLLGEMCSGNRRCCYCEDSVADEVEHVRPKDLYPERVFDWMNYLYACGACNSPKNNSYAVLLRDGTQLDVTRRHGDPVVEPASGDPALIDPRVEDPLRFLDLDIIDTFLFLPADGLDARDERRAEYTIDLLHLNDREVLVQARRTAYGSYRARLFEYREKREGGAAPPDLEALVAGLRLMPQPTVWMEMKRRYEQVSELAGLFGDIPEALRW